jgi:N4-gp56 family major capsid protein
MPFPTPVTTKTQAATFIPQLWSDEIIATYEKTLVAVPLVKNMPMEGKKGDTINIPKPVRGAASAKAAGTAVTLIANTEGTQPVSINQHWEYSRFIEDIVDVQALSSLRQFYTADAGYALAVQADSAIIQLARSAQGGGGTNTYATAWIGSNGTTLYTSGASNAAALADAGLRRAIQRLDDADIPMEGRFLIIPPSARNSLLGNDRFTLFNSVGEAGGANSIRTGKIGDIYGVPVYVSTNADTAAGNSATDRVVLLAHRDWSVFVSQMKPRVQTQYKQEYLADLMTADILYGVAELRDNAAVPLIVTA